METVKYHELSNLFPMFDQGQMLELINDIKNNGLMTPIWTYNGEIIDGRNRYEACIKAGVPPEYQEFDRPEEELLPFILSLNLQRRHLSQSQKAMIATKLKPYYTKQARERMIAGNNADPGDNSPQGRASDQAGKMLGVSGKTVQRAEKIIAEHPEYIAPIQSGEKTINAARAEIKAKQAPPGPEAVKATLDKADTQIKDALARQREAEPPSIRAGRLLSVCNDLTDAIGHCVQAVPAAGRLVAITAAIKMLRNMSAEMQKGEGTK